MSSAILVENSSIISVIRSSKIGTTSVTLVISTFPGPSVCLLKSLGISTKISLMTLSTSGIISSTISLITKLSAFGAMGNEFVAFNDGAPAVLVFVVDDLFNGDIGFVVEDILVEDLLVEAILVNDVVSENVVVVVDDAVVDD
jgi:hypothetical protein